MLSLVPVGGVISNVVVLGVSGAQVRVCVWMCRVRDDKEGRRKKKKTEQYEREDLI